MFIDLFKEKLSGFILVLIIVILGSTVESKFIFRKPKYKIIFNDNDINGLIITFKKCIRNRYYWIKSGDNIVLISFHKQFYFSKIIILME